MSGPRARAIAIILSGREPRPRHAHHGPWYADDGEVIDEGILLFFPGPHSFTGEDVLELQGHGGPVVLDLLLDRCVELGARLARPGEFSERAFLNDKLDLAQAEAIADLIEASSAQAARNAVRSLQGAFSERVGALTEQLVQLRIYVEAAIDFPEEEIDFLADGHVLGQLQALQAELDRVLREAGQGALLREGMTVVIAGRPNAGKSSLLNALAEREAAIVTDIAGTTRDVLREHIHIDGMPLHVIDTAGLRQASDQVERIGVQRALAAIEQADRILLVVDATAAEAGDPMALWPEFLERAPDPARVTLVRNKIDLLGEPAGIEQPADAPLTVALSARSGEGMSLLREHLKACMGYDQTAEGGFSARRRHLEALRQAAASLAHGRTQLTAMAPANCWPRTCARPSRRSAKSPAPSAPTTCSGGSSPASASASKPSSPHLPL